jgi:hypothetical protein
MLPAEVLKYSLATSLLVWTQATANTICGFFEASLLKVEVAMQVGR